MTRSEKNKIVNWSKNISDEELRDAYYDAVFDSLGSQTEAMYELGYDVVDILEREKYENYLCQRLDVLEELCFKRCIVLWED